MSEYGDLDDLRAYIDSLPDPGPFHPHARYQETGDLLEILIEDVSFYGNYQVGKSLCVYHAQDDDRVVGCMIEGLAGIRTPDQLLGRPPYAFYHRETDLLVVRLAFGIPLREDSHGPLKVSRSESTGEVLLIELAGLSRIAPGKADMPSFSVGDRVVKDEANWVDQSWTTGAGVGVGEVVGTYDLGLVSVVWPGQDATFAHYPDEIRLEDATVDRPGEALPPPKRGVIAAVLKSTSDFMNHILSYF